MLALLLIGAVALILVVDFDARIAEHRGRAMASAAEAFGRRVEVGAVNPSWWPLGVEARDVSIEGLVHADAVELRVSLSRLIASFGREVVIDSVVLAHPVVEIVRDEHGRLSYSDIVEHLKQRPDLGSVDRIAIENGTISFIDRAAPSGTGLFFIDDLDAVVENLKPGESAELSVDMGVLSKVHNFELTARTAALDFDRLPSLAQGNLRIQSLPLRALRLWLPKDTNLDVMQAQLSADVELTDQGEIAGESAIADLVIDGGAPQLAKLVGRGRIDDDRLALSLKLTPQLIANIGGETEIEIGCTLFSPCVRSVDDGAASASLTLR